MDVDTRNQYRRWSLGRMPITIERYSGSWVNGVIYKDLLETIETFGSAQPFNSIEADQIMINSRGNTVEKPLIIYLGQKVYVDDSLNEDQTVSDLLIIDGAKWKPVTVNNWNFLDLPHFRVVARYYDGD